MKTLQQLKERKDELENELSAYKWWGNEDDANYEEEYGREYEHLQTELNGVNEEIYKFKNPYAKGLETKTLELHTFKGLRVHAVQKYIKHKIWLSIQKKCELKEKYQNGEFENDSKFFTAINIQNGIIMGLKELGTELGRVQSGLEVRYEFPTKTYPNPKTLRINELGEADTQPIDNQSVTNY